MESSSDNSFTWTDTTSDSSSMTADEMQCNGRSDENCGSHDHRKRKKSVMSPTRNLSHDESALKGDIKGENSNNYFKTNTNISVNKQIIKLEPESDHEVPKKKRKHNESNGNQNDSIDSVSYDESYLKMKVKQEAANASSGSKHKHKKHKHLSTDSKLQVTSGENYHNESIIVNLQEFKYDTNLSNSKKKKKKSKKRCDSGDHNPDSESRMDMDEKLVNKQDDFVKESNPLLEDSTESCDEISHIKCDDEHSLHAISIISKTLEDNSEAKNDNTLNETSIHQTSGHNYKKREAVQHRTQRISDRIRFEDDDDILNGSVGEHQNDFENSKKSAKFEKFLRTNSDFRMLSQKLDKNMRLTSDDEIWILKCPKEIDIKDFKNASLNINNKCKIKVAGQTYDSSAEEEQSGTIPLVTIKDNQYKIRNFSLSGIINLRKRIPKAHFRDDNIMVNNQTNFIALPDTKCRHPLFGTNYKKALKLPSAISERLNLQNAQEYIMKDKKSKKKKEKKDRDKKKNVEHIDPQERHDLPMKMEPNTSVEMTDRKKKKRKYKDDDASSKKVKLIKHDLESAEAWESEKAIEENLFNF